MRRKSDSLPLDSLSMNSCGSACSCSTDNTLGRTANQAAAAATTTNHTAAVATVDQVAAVEPPGGDLRESRRVKVEYLGSIPVENKATDLRSLQVGQSSTIFNVVVFMLWIKLASHLHASYCSNIQRLHRSSFPFLVPHDSG